MELVFKASLCAARDVITNLKQQHCIQKHLSKLPRQLPFTYDVQKTILNCNLGVSETWIDLG